MATPEPRPVTSYVCPRCGNVCRRADGRPYSEGYRTVIECPEDGGLYSVRVEKGAARTRAV